MRTVRIAAVVVAILGGIDALLGYVTVVRAGGGSVGYPWFLSVSVVALVGGSVAVLSRPRAGKRAEEGWAAEDYEPRMGGALFWLGIIVLDVLFALFLLWLFVPSLALSQRLFSSWGGILAIAMLDVGIISILVGYSRTSPAID
jgi:hypothetical protein